MPFYLQVNAVSKHSSAFSGNNWELGKKRGERHIASGPGVTRYTANCFGYFLKTSPRASKDDPTSGQISKWICLRLDVCLPDLKESLHVTGFGNCRRCILSSQHRSAIGTVISWTLPFLQLQTLPCCAEELQLLLLGVLSKAYSCDGPQRPMHSIAYWNRWGEGGMLHRQSTFV